MSTLPTIRLHLFHARASTRTVILRQGPSKMFRMVLWDRKGDYLEDGQWLKQKVYTERCDISPDGRHFIYFTYHARTPGLYSYTAISRPPYFSALALFPELASVAGGGHFQDNRHYVILNWLRPEKMKPQQTDIEHVTRVETGPATFVNSKGDPLRLSPTTQEWAEADFPPLLLGHYETEGPCLYGIKNGSRHLIRDFADMSFEPITAPYVSVVEWYLPEGGKA